MAKQTCAVEGCKNLTVALGKCSVHYNRDTRGSPSKKSPRVVRTGDRSVTIVVRCPKTVATALFGYAKKNGFSRSLALQTLIEKQLNVK